MDNPFDALNPFEPDPPYLYDAEEASRNPEQLSGIVVFGSSGLQGQPDPPPPKDSLSCSSPASPRRAGPAAETPREGGGTAGGAPPDCCSRMQKYQMVTGWFPPRLAAPHKVGSFMHAQANMRPDFCPWCGQDLDNPPSPETPDPIPHLARDPQGRLVDRDWPSGPGSELTALLVEQERRIEELQKQRQPSWVSALFPYGPLRNAARAGSAEQRGDFDDAYRWFRLAMEEAQPMETDDRPVSQEEYLRTGAVPGITLDETGAIRPREGMLKRVLRRLWPVGGRDTSRKAG